MLETNIKDYKQEVIKLFEQLKTSVNKLDNSSKYETELEEIKKQINRPNPSLMFYGIYNAGKSSVLNAIYGEEKASVNDIPETHRVTEYVWKNFILVDTPGLNGPPEDEKVTAPEVKKRDIIVFIIDDSDNFDSEEITRKIVEILEMKKPCIIVINKKNDSDIEKIYHIKQKMNQNIRKMSGISQPENLYDFIDVNAKIGLMGKQGSKEKLLQLSNIGLLEELLSKKLASIDKIQMLKVPLGNMEDLCDTMLQELHRSVKNTDTKILEELLKKMAYVKSNAILKFESNLNEKINHYINTMYSQMAAGQEADFNKNQCEQEINQLVNECISQYCEEINATTENVVEKWKLELNVDKVLDERTNFKPERISSNVENTKDGMDDLLDVLEKLSIIVPIPTPPMPIPIPPTVLIGFLKMLKGLFKPKEKTRTIDVEELNERQREAYEKHNLALRELRNQIIHQMNQFSDKVKGLFSENIEKIYVERKQEIEKIMEENLCSEQRWLNLIQEVEENKKNIQVCVLD